MKVEFNTTEFAEWLLKNISVINFNSILPQIREIVRTSIDRNFSEEGRYGTELFGGGTNKWKRSKRADLQSGQTLSDTGQLAASIRIFVSQTGNNITVDVGSNKLYAPIHQFGYEGDVTVKAHTRKRRAHNRRTKTGKLVPVRAHTQEVNSYTRKSNLPKRPFLVLQKEDIDDIKALVFNEIIKQLNK